MTVLVTTCLTLICVGRLLSGSVGSLGDHTALYGEYSEEALLSGERTLAGEYGL